MRCTSWRADLEFRGLQASAPLLAFHGEAVEPPVGLPVWDSQAYYRVITATAKHYSQACAANIGASFGLLAAQGETAAGRARLAQVCCFSPHFLVSLLPTPRYNKDPNPERSMTL